MVLLLEMELNEQGGEHLSCLGHQFRVFFRQQHGASTCDNLSPVHYLLQINAVSTCSNTFLQLYNLDYQLKSSKHPLPKNTILLFLRSMPCVCAGFQKAVYCRSAPLCISPYMHSCLYFNAKEHFTATASPSPHSNNPKGVRPHGGA